MFFCIAIMPALAQEKIVTGKVTDSKDGSPLANVTIQVKGSKTATQTAPDGTFKLKVSGESTLVFSSIGFAKQELSSNSSTFDISLVQSNATLSEVVVVGYGTSKKKDLTGSVASVSSKDFNQGAVTNPLQQISGRSPGVTVTLQGSEPGVAPSVRIRGITSLSGGNDPLVVIDGVQGDLALLGQISPNEIESFDILKDASATAIYGSRGAAGVILVTTKKAKAGGLVIDYNGVISFEKISKNYDLLNAQQWRDFKKSQGLTLAPDYGGNTDWVNKVTQNGLTHSHNIGFGSGSEGFNYRASISAILQDGTTINSGNKNYIGHIQINQKGLGNKLTLQTNLNVSTLETKWNNVLNTAYDARPTDPIFYKGSSGNDTSIYFRDTLTSFGYVNPYARAKEIIDGRKQNTLYGSFKADFEIISGLSAGIFGSLNKIDNVAGSYKGKNTTLQEAISESGVARRETNLIETKLMNLNLNYKKTFGKSNLNATFVYEYQKLAYEGYGVTMKGFANDILSFNALQSGTFSKVSTGDINSYKNEQTLASFLGRINYSYMGKYLLTVSLRKDGSSKFGANNKWATFPSLSAAWRVSEESLFKKQNIVNDLKVRVGYGSTGNQSGLSPLNSVQLVNSSGSVYFNGVTQPNFAITQNANPNLKWETKTQFNAGVDFALLNNKITGTIDAYVGKTKDLLFTYTVPSPPYPVSSLYANLGTISNKGVEVSINYNIYRNKDWNVTLSGNIAHNKNIVEELSGTIDGKYYNTDTVTWGSGYVNGEANGGINDVSFLIKGKPVGTLLLLRHIGVDEKGSQVFSNPSKTGIVDGSRLSKDRYEAGNVQPIFTYGFSPSISYKQFDFSVFFRGVYGNKIYNSKRSQLAQTTGRFAKSNIINEALTNGIAKIDYVSDFWVESGSFLRLDNLTLGYRINTKAVKYISNARVFVTGNNLFVITKYKGLDPEINSGIDSGIYPKTRNVAIGINLSLK